MVVCCIITRQCKKVWTNRKKKQNIYLKVAADEVDESANTQQLSVANTSDNVIWNDMEDVQGNNARYLREGDTGESLASAFQDKNVNYLRKGGTGALASALHDEDTDFRSLVSALRALPLDPSCDKSGVGLPEQRTSRQGPSRSTLQGLELGRGLDEVADEVGTLVAYAAANAIIEDEEKKLFD